MQPERKRPHRVGRWLVLLTVTVMGACQEEVTEVGDVSPEMEALEAPIVFGLVAYLTSTGVRQGRIEADTAYTYADSVNVDLRVMTAVFFDDNGNERATVTGRTGEWEQDTDRMVARGDVVLLIHEDGSRIESSEIHYDPSIDRVWSDSATVRTMADGRVTRGSSFESDIEFDNVEIRDPRGDIGRIF